MANDDGQTYFYEEHHSLFLKISHMIKYFKFNFRGGRSRGRCGDRSKVMEQALFENSNICRARLEI